MSIIYLEDNIEEYGVSHNWHNTVIKDSIITRRDTNVEIIERPGWGLACYMNNSIQSALIDEKIYHESLVHPVMLSQKNPQKVMIIGGGEGATAREILKWSTVQHIDMYEWDEDVVNLFKTKYPEWAKGAWNDPRLKLHFVDIFEEILKVPTEKYDIVIIDLFEPTEENQSQWNILLKSLNNWITSNGSIVMYAGMRNILLGSKQPYKTLENIIKSEYHQYQCIPYRVYIPSFSGESMFLLCHTQQTDMDFNNLKSINSHLSDYVWNSYKTLNW